MYEVEGAPYFLSFAHFMVPAGVRNCGMVTRSYMMWLRVCRFVVAYLVNWWGSNQPTKQLRAET